jgi:hypothetical protein
VNLRNLPRSGAHRKHTGSQISPRALSRTHKALRGAHQRLEGGEVRLGADVARDDQA